VSAPEPERFLARLFDSKSQDNFGRFNNPRVDQLLADARSTTDGEERLRIFTQVNKAVVDDIPAAFLMHRVGIAGVNTRVHGLTLNLYGLPEDKLATVEIR